MSTADTKKKEGIDPDEWLKPGVAALDPSQVCETVRVVRPECPGGFCEINKSDFTDDMELFEDNDDQGNGDGDGDGGDEVLDILKGSADKIKEAIADLDSEDLDSLLEAETDSENPRKVVIKILEKAIDARE